MRVVDVGCDRGGVGGMECLDLGVAGVVVLGADDGAPVTAAVVLTGVSA